MKDIKKRTTICSNIKKHIAICATLKIFELKNIKFSFYQTHDMRDIQNWIELSKLPQSYQDMGGYDGMKEIYNKKISRNKKRNG